MTTERLNIDDVDHNATKAVLALETYVLGSQLDGTVRELVKIRASQLNGCAFCLDMHLREARARGEDQRRLDVIGAWREAKSLFNAREQAALALTESMTELGREGVPDAIWNEAASQFNESDLVALLIAISAINVWNRLAVAAHKQLPDL